MIEHERIGKYRVIARIGEGAMGQVYKAFDPLLNRPVALKTIAKGLAADPEFRRRFQREAQSAARLNHPNVITIYDYGEDPESGLTYMAMELLDGTDLREALRDGSLRTLRGKLEVMRQLCDGLGFAHAHGVLHRDIKPGNIHVLPGGRVKVLDFGLARIESSDITRTGTVLGTPNYMSPEQVRGERVDARSDVFSLGVVFYEILTGRRAFDAPSLYDILQSILEREPEPTRRLAPDTPPALVAVVERALAKDAARRYADASELGHALAAASGSEPGVEATRVIAIDDLATTILRADPPPQAAAAAAADAAVPLVAPPPPPAARTARPPRPAGAAQGGTAGALALQRRDGAEGEPATRRVPGTLPGSVESRRLGAGSMAAVIGGPLLVLLIAGGLALWLHGRPSAATTLRADELGQARANQVDSAIERARADLGSRRYATAAVHAREALALDATNPVARELLTRAETARHELETALEEARAAYARGDLPVARVAVTRVLAMDPGNAVAGELSAQIDSSVRNRAEAARQARAGAGVPPPGAAPRQASAAEPAPARHAPVVPEPPVAVPQPAPQLPAAEAPSGRIAIVPPVLVSQMAPRFPPEAGNVEGSVQLTALVDDKGEVSDVRVLRASPPNVGFEAAAVEHARSRRYRPATRGGVPIATRVAIIVNFVVPHPASR